MEMRHLRYVVAAAEQGSFRRAAMALDIRESAVSRRIRDLEDEIGAALFMRHHGGVNLTYAGQRFVYRALRALNEIERAAADAGSFGRGEIGTVRIGIFTSLASGFLSDLLRAYVSANPGVRPDLIEGGPAAHIAAVQRLHLDIAFLTGKPVADGCDVAQLWNERVLAVIPRKHEFASLRTINWMHLRDRHFIVSEDDPGPEIHDYLVKHIGDLGHHPSIERHRVGRDNLMHLVAMGQGLTLVHEAAGAAQFPGVIYRHIKDEILPFCAIWSPRNDNPALRRLLSLARTMSKTIVQRNLPVDASDTIA